MHRKFWFLVAAAVAVFALTGTAAATGARQGATQFQKDWANIKWTPQARAASGQINFGMEQPCPGFNAIDGDETAFWCVVAAEAQVLRGNYIIDNHAAYHLDMASSVTSTKTTLTIVIKPGANWAVEGGGTSPVVASDYAFTYNVIMDPRNPVASTTGYNDINQNNPYTMPDGPNGKKIIFHWAHPFADWKDLFGGILPGFALPTANQLGANGGQAFSELWLNCICVETYDSNSGDLVDHPNQQVSDGPMFLDSWDPANGAINVPNNRWYGPNPQISQVNFIRTTPGSTEANGLTGGQLDAAFPAPAAAYVGIRSNGNFTYNTAKGFVQEHLDFNQANPLLAHPWMRQSIALGINRPAVIKAVYYDTNIIPTGGMSQLNSPEYVLNKYSKSPYDYFKTWNFNRTRALNILAQHCTGGPSSPNPNNTKVWQCPDGPASFDFYTTLLPTRGASATIYQSELMEIGIKLTIHQTAALFSTVLPNAQTNSCISGGQPQQCGADSYDIAEYAWVGSPDPSGFDAINQCYDTNGLGGQNYKNYCNLKINAAQNAGDVDLTSTRYQHYLTVSKIISNNVYIMPLYARPNILIYNNSIGGMANSNNPTSVGPTWNIEDWTN